MPAAVIFWTVERLDFIREHTDRPAQWIADQIAIESNRPVSRNSVIGAANRAGIILTASKGQHMGKVREPKRSRPRPKPPPPLKPPEPTRTLEGLVRLMDLQPHHCRSIEGHDGLALFCGQPVVFGTSWCWHHLMRYVTPGAHERLLSRAPSADLT